MPLPKEGMNAKVEVTMKVEDVTKGVVADEDRNTGASTENT